MGEILRLVYLQDACGKRVLSHNLLETFYTKKLARNFGVEKL
jgi:hypothetical protein